jgi:hypothetical protein
MGNMPARKLQFSHFVSNFIEKRLERNPHTVSLFPNLITLITLTFQYMIDHISFLENIETSSVCSQQHLNDFQNPSAFPLKIFPMKLSCNFNPPFIVIISSRSDYAPALIGRTIYEDLCQHSLAKANLQTDVNVVYFRALKAIFVERRKEEIYM